MPEADGKDSGSRRRFPDWVYRQGQDPDYRFTLANERTFLAWIRTALAFLAGGVAIEFVDLGIEHTQERALVLLLLGASLLCTVTAWVRWAKTERAMRRGEPLPQLGFGLVLVIALVMVGATIALVAK